MLKIDDLRKDLFIGDFGEYFVDYDKGIEHINEVLIIKED